MMKAIIKQLSKVQFHLFNIPEDFAEEAEIIILAIKPLKNSNTLSEDETFYTANNDQIIGDNKIEDQKWCKYSTDPQYYYKNMEIIKRIITKKEFKLYNVPENFGEMAEIIIRPTKFEGSSEELDSFNILKLQEESGMMKMLNEQEEDYWNDL